MPLLDALRPSAEGALTPGLKCGCRAERPWRASDRVRDELAQLGPETPCRRQVDRVEGPQLRSFQRCRSCEHAIVDPSELDRREDRSTRRDRGCAGRQKSAQDLRTRKRARDEWSPAAKVPADGRRLGFGHGELLSVIRMPLKPGDKAPDFTLLDQHGEPFTLSKSLKQRKCRHLIYFYPGA